MEQYGNATTFNIESVLHKNIKDGEYFNKTCVKLTTFEAIVDEVRSAPCPLRMSDVSFVRSHRSALPVAPHWPPIVVSLALRCSPLPRRYITRYRMWSPG